MKISVKTNFDFSKLANALPDVINKYLEGYAEDTVKGTRRNIDNGSGADGKSLSLGASSYRAGQQALYNTGEMYNSLKRNKNVFFIKEYGYRHNQGEYPTVSGTNVRNFIGTTKENKEKIDKNFMSSVQKALRK